MSPEQLEPAYVEFKIVRGSNFIVPVTLYEDEAQTKPWSFAGRAASLRIGSAAQPLLVLSAGHGLNAMPLVGKLEPYLLGSETRSLPLGEYDALLELVLEANPGDVLFPLDGKAIISDP